MEREQVKQLHFHLKISSDMGGMNAAVHVREPSSSFFFGACGFSASAPGNLSAPAFSGLDGFPSSNGAPWFAFLANMPLPATVLLPIVASLVVGPLAGRALSVQHLAGGPLSARQNGMPRAPALVTMLEEDPASAAAKK